MSKLVNLFGGPGIGKSGIAAGITYKLKKETY
jgi:DNA replication protein DnaC